jgi:excinuclease UvrABC nuclease subunit
MVMTNIYVLIDPETNQVRYVGKANNVSQRYKAHLNGARKHQIHKLNWINSLKKKKLKPIIEVVDIVPIEEWVFWETYWISQFKTWGFNLINYTQGGDGITFANQTSFKKGNRPWNFNLGRKFICPVCLKEYNPHYKTQISCNIICSNKIKKKSNTQFNLKNIPWNKGIKGYKVNSNYKPSEETKLKISLAKKGKESKKKRIINQYDQNMNFITQFTSITEAKKMTGIKGISNALTGRAKTAGGYIWQ